MFVLSEVQVRQKLTPQAAPGKARMLDACSTTIPHHQEGSLKLCVSSQLCKAMLTVATHQMLFLCSLLLPGIQTFLVSSVLISELRQKPVPCVALCNSGMLDTCFTLFFHLVEKLQDGMIFLSAELCQLRGGIHVDKVKLVFLPFSVQLFLTLSFV